MHRSNLRAGGRSAQRLKSDRVWRRCRERFTKLVIEYLEPRNLLASDWTNPFYQRDVNNTGTVTPQDALVSINELNSRTILIGQSQLPDREAYPEKPFYDTTGDGMLTPQDVLLVVNALNGDSTGATITSRLRMDTAPGGANSDSLTFDPGITGHVQDDFQHGTGVQFLEARVDGGTYESVTTLSPNGDFVFVPNLMVDGRNDGIHLVQFRATDGRLNISESLPISFELDTQPPAEPAFDLSLTSDSDTLGDQTTSFSRVTIVGQTDPGLLVTLAGVCERPHWRIRQLRDSQRVTLAGRQRHDGHRP